MPIRALLLALTLLPAAVAAQPAPERVEIALSSFKFAPATIALHHGQPYVLHFVNTSDGGHDFVAKRFFAAARVASDSAVRNGEVELKGGESGDVHLVAPAAGTYEAHCSHFMHSSFGMKATIVVS